MSAGFVEMVEAEAKTRKEMFERNEHGYIRPPIGMPVYAIQLSPFPGRVGDLQFNGVSQDYVICDKESALQLAGDGIVWEMRRIT